MIDVTDFMFWAKGTHAAFLSGPQAANGARNVSANDAAGTTLPNWYPDIAKTILDDAALSVPLLDHTATIQSVIDAAPANVNIVMPRRARWFFKNLTMTRAQSLDFNGSSLLVQPAPGAGVTTGNPAIWVKGSLGAQVLINDVTQLSSTIVCRTAAQAAGFPAGSMIRVMDHLRVWAWNDLNHDGAADAGSTDGSGIGYQDRYETNFVISSNPTTGVIVLARPVEWLYQTYLGAAPFIHLITPVIDATVKNFNITEVDPGGVFNGANIQSGAPHLVKFDYCIRPRIENVSADGYQLHVFNFDTCDSPRAHRVRGANAFRPSQGGHGYVGRFNRCTDGIATECQGLSVRHVIDHAQSYHCGSMFCVGRNTTNASYVQHGTGEKRCWNFRDAHYSGDANPGAAGWAFGDYDFSSSYGGVIASPVFVGTGTAVIACSQSDDLTIFDPHFTGCVPAGSGNQFRGVLVVQGATNVKIRGGVIDGSQVFVTGCELVTARNNVTTANTFALKPDLLSVEGVTLIAPFGDGVSTMYSIHTSQCSRVTITKNTFVSVSNSQQGCDILQDGTNNGWVVEENYLTGPTSKYGIQNTAANPLGLDYRVRNNRTDRAYNIRFLDLMNSQAIGAAKTAIATLGAITAGVAYTNGVYNAVALVSSTGVGMRATANITVAGGVVTAVTLVTLGVGYAVGDTLTATAASIGGTGAGFSVPVATLTSVASLIEEGNCSEIETPLTFAATISTDPTYNVAGQAPALRTSFSVTLTGNATLGAVGATAPSTHLRDGRRYRWKITQDAIGNRTLAYASQFKFPGGAPVLSTAAGAVDIIEGRWSVIDQCFYCTIAKAVA
jgi:hypothetical protein